MKQKLAAILAIFYIIAFVPDAMSQWVRTNGPYGSSITCFAIDNGNIFAGTSSDGIFLSTDNGASWKRADNGLPDSSTNIYSFGVIGTSVFTSTAKGLFVSRNHGALWDSIP